MSPFISVARGGEIPEGQGRRFSVGRRQIALFLLEGEYFAMDDHCPHMGASLSLGDLDGDTVVCDRHLWAFSLRDGSCADVPGLVAETFAVRTVGDQIQVCLPDDEAPDETA